MPAQPPHLGLGVPGVSDTEPFIAPHPQHLVQREGLPRPVGSDDDHGRHGALHLTQHVEPRLVQFQLRVIGNGVNDGKSAIQMIRNTQQCSLIS